MEGNWGASQRKEKWNMDRTPVVSPASEAGLTEERMLDGFGLGDRQTQPPFQLYEFRFAHIHAPRPFTHTPWTNKSLLYLKDATRTLQFGYLRR